MKVFFIFKENFQFILKKIEKIKVNEEDDGVGGFRNNLISQENKKYIHRGIGIVMVKVIDYHPALINNIVIV